MEASRTLHRPVLGDAVFDRLVRAHRAPLERYVRGLGASREDAEEIAATALLRAYQSPPAAHRESEWRAWLSTVARNVWIDARRRRELRLVTADGVLESVASDNASVDQIAATAEEARQICAAIALLPPAQRAAIYLREVRGLSYEEIAAQLGITIMAATAILQRARGTVKQRRGGLSGALSALAFSPLALVRRGARFARSGSAYGAAVKVAMPVALMAGAGGAVVVAQHPAAGAQPQTPAAVTRFSSVGAALAAKRNPLTVLVPLAIRSPASPLGSSPRHVPWTQQLSGPLPGSPVPAAAATANAGVPATAPIAVTAGAKHTGHSGKPAPGAHKQHARNAAAQHARIPPKHTRGGAPAGLRGVGAKRAAARPATAAAPSSHSRTAAQDKHAPVAHAAAAPATTGSAHGSNTAPAAPPAAAAASGAAPKSPAAASPSPSNAAPPAAPGGAPGAPAQAATPAAEPPSAHGSANAHAPA
ncbi:MAG TPA: sigma-70 family RNA polymerase sigma factor [Gaiellales bacterium]|nr:sigma-70 family RNA polymerase sigma factor [Gaiellales bacterium]